MTVIWSRVITRPLVKDAKSTDPLPFGSSAAAEMVRNAFTELDECFSRTWQKSANATGSTTLKSGLTKVRISLGHAVGLCHMGMRFETYVEYLMAHVERASPNLKGLEAWRKQ